MSEKGPSRLKEMALRGKEYSEIKEYDYFGGVMEVSMSPLEDTVLIPYAAVLEEKFGYEDLEEAAEEIEETRDDRGDVDPSKVDEDFVELMGEVCVDGVNTDEGHAEGADEEELREIFGVHDDEEENIGLTGGLTLEIAQDVINLSSDEEAAQKFRR